MTINATTVSPRTVNRQDIMDSHETEYYKISSRLTLHIVITYSLIGVLLILLVSSVIFYHKYFIQKHLRHFMRKGHFESSIYKPFNRLFLPDTFSESETSFDDGLYLQPQSNNTNLDETELKNAVSDSFSSDSYTVYYQHSNIYQSLNTIESTKMKSILLSQKIQSNLRKTDLKMNV